MYKIQSLISKQEKEIFSNLNEFMAEKINKIFEKNSAMLAVYKIGNSQFWLKNVIEIPIPKHTLAYYQFLVRKLEELDDKILSGATKQEENKIKINPGDWVTVYKPYAIEHGRSALKNTYRVISKTVLASDVYISSDSVFEFSYIP